MRKLAFIVFFSVCAFGFARRHPHHTPTPTPKPSPSPTATAAPTPSPSPTATPITSPSPTASVTVSWTATAGDSYRLFYSTSGTFGAGVDVGIASSYTVTGLTIGQGYYFTLTARNAKGESAKATPVQYKPLSAKRVKLKLGGY